MNHKFFKGLDLDALKAKKIVPKFIPTIDESGLNNFDTEITAEKADESVVPNMLQNKVKAREEDFKDFGFHTQDEQKKWSHI